MPLRHAVGIGALLVAVLFSSPEALGKAAEVPNFNLPDLGGRNHELRRAEGKAVVLFFTGLMEFWITGTSGSTCQ